MGIISYLLHCTQYTDVTVLHGRRAQSSGEGAGTQEFFSGVM